MSVKFMITKAGQAYFHSVEPPAGDRVALDAIKGPPGASLQTSDRVCVEAPEPDDELVVPGGPPLELTVRPPEPDPTAALVEDLATLIHNSIGYEGEHLIIHSCACRHVARAWLGEHIRDLAPTPDEAP